jgi:RimJ/RimL family protein N-acetyltransferase
MGHATHAFGTLQSKESIRLNILKEIESSSMFPDRKRFIILRKEDMKPIGEMNYSSWDARNQKCEFQDVVYMDLIKSDWLSVR